MIAMRCRPAIFALALIALLYLWLGIGMNVFHSPMLTMLVSFPILCFGGGTLLRRLGAESAPLFSESEPAASWWAGRPAVATALLAILATAVLWAGTLLIRPGLIDPTTMSDGLRSIGMTREHYWIAAGLLAAVNPFAEEYLWRWSVLPAMMTFMRRGPAVHLTGLLFAGYHPLIICMLFPPAWLVLVFVISYLGGVVFANLLIRTRHLGYPIALHLVVNLNLMMMGFLYAPSSTP